MSKVQTEQYPFKEDLGKNLYRKKTYYTLCIQQDVLDTVLNLKIGLLPTVPILVCVLRLMI